MHRTQDKIERAIILSAGMGIRLRPLTLSKPKCLLPFRGRTILEYQLEQLIKLGIPEILVVVGYEAGQVINILPRSVRYVVNPDYQTTNSVYSLYLTGEALDGNILLLNGDVVYDDALLSGMIESLFSNALLVDFDRPLEDAQMNVKVKNGLVSEIGKHIPAALADGESAQMVKFCRESARLLQSEIKLSVEVGRVNVYPSDLYSVVIKQDGLHAIETAGHSWFEVDTPADYQRLCACCEDAKSPEQKSA